MVTTPGKQQQRQSKSERIRVIVYAKKRRRVRISLRGNLEKTEWKLLRGSSSVKTRVSFFCHVLGGHLETEYVSHSVQGRVYIPAKFLSASLLDSQASPEDVGTGGLFSPELLPIVRVT